MKLRILLVGASGIIGQAIKAELAPRHEIITAGRNSGDIRINIADAKNIISGLSKAGPLDAVICAAGQGAFAPLADFKPANIGESLHTLGLTDKLMGQVNLALAARDVLKQDGSITLTSGLLTDHFIAAGHSASMVNSAIDGFARAAAVELRNGLRINVVSPSIVLESMPQYGAFFRGFDPVPAARVALAYSRSVEGLETGQVYKVF